MWFASFPVLVTGKMVNKTIFTIAMETDFKKIISDSLLAWSTRDVHLWAFKLNRINSVSWLNTAALGWSSGNSQDVPGFSFQILRFVFGASWQELHTLLRLYTGAVVNKTDQAFTVYTVTDLSLTGPVVCFQYISAKSHVWFSSFGSTVRFLMRRL